MASLRLDGDSTLHRYSARTNDVRGVVHADAGSADVAELVRTGHVTHLEVAAPVEKLTSGDGSLDKTMWAALKSGPFKELRFQADRFALRPTTAQGASFGLAVQGELAVAGVTRPLALEADAVAMPDGVRVAGRTSLRMTDYGIKPPTLMFGAIKTADLVVVTFALELCTLPGAQPGV